MTSMPQSYEQYLKELPEPVQEVIRAANVPEKMRALAKEYQLHLDKWAALENEIMLALVGAKPAELLADNIAKAVGVDQTTALAMTDDIAQQVFRPIREALEQKLDFKRQARETLMQKGQESAQPADKPLGYAPGVKSSERKSIHDDPYREPIE